VSNDLGELGFTEDLTWYLSTPSREWLRSVVAETDQVLRCVAAVLHLVVPEWQANRPKDSLPIRAITAALKYCADPSQNNKKQVSILSKGCSESRRKSLGYEHRIAEAARAFATAAISEDEERKLSSISEALSKIEEHILYKHSIKADYRKETDTRHRMLTAFADGLRALKNPDG
jgi:hypothetical protein